MGTPHKGAWMADWAKISATMFGFVESTNMKLLGVGYAPRIIWADHTDHRNMVKFVSVEETGFRRWNYQRARSVDP
ncbi:unnamed protein product [Penicillium roqueforti FM164]|uniref:Genomic scaffold, ProqFM164S02 n=1 Tax=Penicillium roqueforti (strain FM164) TaxID=1365484 RepID=W6Q724_PENRF|nr:unnamed protein product [Penicillium roqueforti FM164]